MFYVNLYSCTADPRERDKSSSLTTIGSVPISPTAILDIMQPTIIIDYSPGLISANYAYIPDFGKYYFLDPPKIQTGKRIIYTAKVDVLMTLSSQLLDVEATVIRSESIGAPTPIPDSQLPINPERYELKSILFDKPFPLDPNQNNFLLITR